MMENNSNGVETPPIELNQVIEGDQIISRNYRFVQIGHPVPIKPGNDDSQYDSQAPPSKPLAVSERFHLLFIAHSNGFFVARTKQVMDLAVDIKDKGSGLSSIDQLSILNLSIGKVSILALSSGDSLLVASVANQLHFFSISALLHKEKKPSFSFCLDDLSCIKDVKWARKAEKDYVVLSSDGKLYHGFGKVSPTNVMVNVNAVEWSAKGAFVAVARNNVVSILSSQFTEKLSFSLSSASIIVDSIIWVRADSIVLGCFEEGDDSEQANYLVHVITTQGSEITDASSEPVVLSFSETFLDYRPDVVPGASGPNLFLSYLDHHELAFIANRKNLSQHVVLLGWSLDDEKNEAAIIELSNDVWCAHIESQENGDDNLVLALSVDKVSQNDEIKFILGEEETEVSPCCILLCLTIDGKISLFHFASAAGPSTSPQVLPYSDSQEDACSQVLPKHGLSEISSEIREQNIHNVSPYLESDESSRVEPYKIRGDDIGNENNQPSASIKNNLDNQEQKPPISFKTLKGYNEDIFCGAKLKPNQDRGNQQFVSTEKTGPNSEHSPFKISHLEVPGIKARDLSKAEAQASYEAKTRADLLSGEGSTDLSSQSVSKNLKACGSLEFQQQNVPTNLMIASPSWLNEKSALLITSEERLSSSSTSVFDKKSSGIPDKKILDSAGALFQSHSPPNETAGRAFQINSSGQRATTMTGDVEVMAKKMDRLLEAIGGEGGLKDASVTSQEGSVVALEAGLSSISERCRMWRGIVEERLRDIQLLHDKTVQVLGRKIYMKGIFQQATDSWYRDLWNCQKLSSELELKRQHIIEVDQDLTSQLVELERHFNTLEFNKFGKGEVLQANERTIHSHANSRQQSLKSLHNTLGAQLAAAEKHSECLWKQMAALSIETPAKKQNVKRELFETLGLTYDGASYNSPGNGKASDAPRKELLTSCSVTAKEKSRRNQCTPVKSSESENVRRRHDSLDQKWSSSEPPKTTVKRMLLQEDRENSSPTRLPVKVEKQHLKLQPTKESPAAYSILRDSSATSSFQHKSKIIAGTQVKQSIEHPVTPLSQWADGLADPGVQVVSSPGLLQQSASTASASLIGTGENHTLSGKSRSSLPLFENSESLSGSDFRYMQQSEVHLLNASAISERFPVVSTMPSKSSVEIPNSSYKEVGPSKSAIKEVKHALITTESCVSDLNSSYKASDPIGSSPSFSQKILHTEIAASKSHPGGTMLSSPAMQSISSLTSQFNLSRTTSSSLSKASAVTSSPAILSSKFLSSSEAKVDTAQKMSQSHLLVSSSLTSPSTLSFPTPKKDGLSSASPNLVDGNSESFESGYQPLVAVFGSKRDGNSINQTMFSNSSLEMGEIFKTPASVSQPGLNGTANLHIGSTVLSTPVTEFPASLKSEDQLNIGDASSPASEMVLNATLEQPYPSRRNSSINVFSGISNNGKNGSSAVSNGDEMEEEAPEGSLTTELALGNLGVFGIGSTPNSTAAKPNPFGVEMLNKAETPLSSPFTMPTPSGELFRPATFNFLSPLPSQTSHPANIASFSSGFSTGSTYQGPTANGFGQPAQFGSGQESLGSVLGAFGQSRQLGASPPISGIAPPSGFASGLSGMSTGGFGGGFSSVASAGGGFSSLATGGGVGGGFAAAATAGGGFAGAGAGAGAGFSGGGFGAFGNQGGGGFSTFASGSGAGRPPSELFTQMRK